ncbi:MAG: hypothetical protein IKG47_01520, partial [Oscillospiraceae bacterium]|nr:hypothetical protein [Oscillospiraceae bacterium]
MLYDASMSEEDRSHPYITLNEKYEIRYLRVTAIELPYNEVFAISGFRVFGKGNGMIPQEVVGVKAERDSNGMDCKIRFDKADGAFGYNIRFGIAENKLYSSYLVYEKTDVLLTTLNADQDYYFSIDSFNENGVSVGTTVYHI